MSADYVKNLQTMTSSPVSIGHTAPITQTKLLSQRDVITETGKLPYNSDIRSQDGGKLVHVRDSEGRKPSLSYIALISMAIQSTPDKKMLLSEIYRWICRVYPYYNMADKSWRNSIRHNLSLNECFVKSGRSDSGKGSYWSIHPANMTDFAKGDYRRRHARKRVRHCDAELQRLCTNQVDTSCTKSTKHMNLTRTDGYIPMTSTTVACDFPPAQYGSYSGLSVDDWMSCGRNAHLKQTTTPDAPTYQHTPCYQSLPKPSVVYPQEPTVTVSLNVNGGISVNCQY